MTVETVAGSSGEISQRCQTVGQGLTFDFIGSRGIRERALTPRVNGRKPAHKAPVIVDRPGVVLQVSAGTGCNNAHSGVLHREATGRKAHVDGMAVVKFGHHRTDRGKLARVVVRLLKEFAKFGVKNGLLRVRLERIAQTFGASRFITEHYRLRKSLGDDRKWGTPFSFLIKDGDLRNVWFVGGEFRPGELEKFLKENL